MRALLLIDIQNDFIEGGALAVPHGKEIIEKINTIIKSDHTFNFIIATQDWHPENHISFESLWPVHCVQNSHGAELVKALNTEKITKIIYKGTDIHIDSYSAFFDNNHEKKTDLDNYLKSQGVNEIYLAGLATDYCVKFTALDACELGYKVSVIKDACRGIGDEKAALEEMQKAGAVIVGTEIIGFS